MNILFASYFGHSKGGAEVSMELLAREIKNRGHNVFIASAGDFDNFQVLKFLKLRYIPFSFRDSYLAWVFRRIIKKNKIDVIHANDRFTAVAAVKAARKENIRSVVHFRDYWYLCPKSTLYCENDPDCPCISSKTKHRKSLRFLINSYKMNYIRGIWSVIRNADVKIAISTNIAEALEKIGVKDYKIIPNFVNIDQFEDINFDVKSKYNLKKYVLGYVGNIDVSKGSEIIKQIILRFKDKNNVSFLIIGRGPKKEDLYNFVISNRIKNVVFVDWVDNKKISAYYNAMNILLVPSLWKEPLGRVLLESAFFGKPFVASNVGDVKNFIKGDFVIVKDPLDIDAWENSIYSLLNNKNAKIKLLDYKDKVVDEVLGLYS
ncbi:MAG TPA: glycosyltransferase family 4 protein [Candidatus Nanoarchaeia archaeon]|nr:glycosyltransferase family 4 protein [Candidatus Nanoarchaeia archaeon]